MKSNFKSLYWVKSSLINHNIWYAICFSRNQFKTKTWDPVLGFYYPTKHTRCWSGNMSASVFLKLRF